MEISDLPLEQGVVGEACLVQEAMWWRPERETADEGGGKMQHIWIPLTLYACFSSEAELPELHINQYTWLWLPWIPEPTFCLFLHHANKTLLSWRCKFSEISSEILCCTKLQLQGTRITQQAGIVLTQTPSLIWAGGNNVHWPISINPSRCQNPHLLLLQGYSAPLPPPLLPSHSLFF